MMRRKDKKITSPEEIEEIIAGAVVCRLAMVDGDQPYIVPLCFGYENRTLYFHTGLKGKKIDVLKKNSNVCFEFDEDCRVLKQPNACDWGMTFRSVIGYGKAFFVNSAEGRRKALDVIMRHYGGSAETYPAAMLDVTQIIRLKILHMTGKHSPIGKG